MLGLGLGLIGRTTKGGGDIPPPAFNPVSLFVGSTAGALFDAEAAGSVTLASGAVSQWTDLSGFGKHATQATASAQPIFEEIGARKYVTGDGVADCLRTADINLSHTSIVTIWAVLQRGVAGRVIAEFGRAYNDAGSWLLSSETEIYSVATGGTGYRAAQNIGPGSGGADLLIARINRAVAPEIQALFGGQTFGVTAQGTTLTGNFNAARPISLLARWSGTATSVHASAKLNVFGMIDRRITDAEVADLTAFYAPRLG